MSAIHENVYNEGETVRCKAFFTDPETTTRLSNNLPVGSTVLPVASGVLGAGFPAGADVVLGDELFVVAAPGSSVTAIPITKPTAKAHRVGEEVGLLLEPSGEVKFRFKPPTGTPAPPVKGEHDQLGVFHADQTNVKGGTYYWMAYDTDGKAVVESSFRVRRSAFA